ncbi:unnamed protein product, partial [Nesidiocoris tenuis]
MYPFGAQGAIFREKTVQGDKQHFYVNCRQVKPLLEVTKQEEKLTQKEDELKQIREKLESQLRSKDEYEKRLQDALEDKAALAEQLQAEVELCAEAEEMRA